MMFGLGPFEMVLVAFLALMAAAVFAVVRASGSRGKLGHDRAVLDELDRPAPREPAGRLRSPADAGGSSSTP